MDPVSLIVAAVAAGALAGLKDSAASAVKDAYGAVKRLLGERYSRVNLSALEDNPKSQIQRAAVTESLEATSAAADEELLRAVANLLTAVNAHDPAAAEAVGVDLKRIDVDIIGIHGVKATGHATGVRAQDVTAKSMNISGVDVDATGTSDRPR